MVRLTTGENLNPPSVQLPTKLSLETGESSAPCTAQCELPADGYTVRDAQYVRRVSQYRPSSLLPAIALLGSALPLGETALPVAGVAVTPWALMDIARVSLVHGSEQRGAPVSGQSVLRCVEAYNDLDHPELAEQRLGAVANFLLRISNEQLIFNIPPMPTISRAVAIFTQTEPTVDLNVIHSGWDEELLGSKVTDYVGAGFLLQTACGPNQGKFDLAWLDEDSPLELNRYMDLAQTKKILTSQFMTSRAPFVRENSATYHDGPYRRFSYNPLFRRPAVKISPTTAVTPVPHSIMLKVSPQGIYYAGVAKWGNRFAKDVGNLFEQYVGRLLKLIPNGIVYPEIVYGRSGQKTVDWIVVLDQVVILVEVKSVRPTDPVRMAHNEWAAELTRMLGKGFEQLNTTDSLIESAHPRLGEIPRDRQRVGMVVTMEDFHVVNASFIRKLYRSDEKIRSLVVSSIELEWLVTIKQDPGEFLRDLLFDSEAEGWSVRSKFGSVGTRPNEVIGRAWDALPSSELDRAVKASKQAKA